LKWKKMGLVYGPEGNSDWARHSALQPTPLVKHEEGLIRVFAGFRDDDGVGRVGFVDLDAENPSKVLGVSRRPALDIGVPGAFDDNGVIPTSVVEREGKLYLFYAGYQLVRKVKFLVFCGLAVSADGGETFTRYSRVPVCDRTSEELYFRVIHMMMLDDGRWRAWYGAGDSFDVEDGKQYPRYNIRHAFSPDGVHLGDDYQVCVDMRGGEYRVGRPYVIKHDGLYKMFFGAGTIAEGYRLAYAESPDGISWTRKDEELGIDVSASGWDSRMQAYPSIVHYRDRTYLFYNGNDYGLEGFGYALLEHW
jgi:predicted GH43/DUF377 family glycosyl hydrolase